MLKQRLLAYVGVINSEVALHSKDAVIVVTVMAAGNRSNGITVMTLNFQEPMDVLGNRVTLVRFQKPFSDSPIITVLQSMLLWMNLQQWRRSHGGPPVPWPAPCRGSRRWRAARRLRASSCGRSYWSGSWPRSRAARSVTWPRDSWGTRRPRSARRSSAPRRSKAWRRI